MIISPLLTAVIENSRSKNGQVCYEHPGRADRKILGSYLFPLLASPFHGIMREIVAFLEVNIESFFTAYVNFYSTIVIFLFSFLFTNFK